MLDQWRDNKAVVLLGAGAVMATLAARPRAAIADRGAWLWPVPLLNGRPPVVSSGWGSPRRAQDGTTHPHRGVDIMYKRRSRSELIERFPPGTPNGSPGYFMPDFIPVFAARDGVVWSARKGPRGHAIVVDHGKPWATYYQHLERMFVPPTERGIGGKRVRAGEILGYVGGSPLGREHLMHLHFELWRGGGPEAAIDPEPIMQSWLVMPWTDASLATEAAREKAA